MSVTLIIRCLIAACFAVGVHVAGERRPASGLPPVASSQDAICIYIMPEVPSKVIGLDAARDKYQITRYTLPDSAPGDLLLVSRAGLPVAILEVAPIQVGRETFLARRFAIDETRGIEIGDDVRPFRVIEQPVR